MPTCRKSWDSLTVMSIYSGSTIQKKFSHMYQQRWISRTLGWGHDKYQNTIWLPPVTQEDLLSSVLLHNRVISGSYCVYFKLAKRRIKTVKMAQQVIALDPKPDDLNLSTYMVGQNWFHFTLLRPPYVDQHIGVVYVDGCMHAHTHTNKYKTSLK